MRRDSKGRFRKKLKNEVDVAHILEERIDLLGTILISAFMLFAASMGAAFAILASATVFLVVEDVFMISFLPEAKIMMLTMIGTVVFIYMVSRTGKEEWLMKTSTIIHKELDTEDLQ